jgi:hypothetical protein
MRASLRRNSCINCSSVSGVAPASKLVRGLALSRILGTIATPQGARALTGDAMACTGHGRGGGRPGAVSARPFSRKSNMSSSTSLCRCSGNALTIRSRTLGPLTQSTCAVPRASSSSKRSSFSSGRWASSGSGAAQSASMIARRAPLSCQRICSFISRQRPWALPASAGIGPKVQRHAAPNEAQVEAEACRSPRHLRTPIPVGLAPDLRGSGIPCAWVCSECSCAWVLGSVCPCAWVLGSRSCAPCFVLLCSLHYALCSVRCALCFVLCALCCLVLCDLCSVLCPMFPCALCSMLCAFCSVLCGLVPCALCSVPCSLLPCALVPCALCPVLVALCPVLCALCAVLCALCLVLRDLPCTKGFLLPRS